jgi:hypothetical protein
MMIMKFCHIASAWLSAKVSNDYRLCSRVILGINAQTQGASAIALNQVTNTEEI